MTKRDDDETVGLFEPLLVEESSPHRAKLNDLALELSTRSAAFRSSLPESISSALADLVRSMNCYYSNLIEGHNTHPIDIERALDNDYSADPKQRDLQLEAKAHITVQTWIDEDGMEDTPTSPAMISEMHRRFCELLPTDLLIVKHPTTGDEISIVPGEFRTQDVEIGRHIAISPGAVPRFLNRAHQVYSSTSHMNSILAAAYSHHRLLWVHPFLDGNGRVARLMSYAMLRTSLDTRGLWSVARGLARNESDYKKHLAACDQERRGDLDGRGTLSEAAMANFACFFIQACINQVDFMESLMKPDRLRDRIMIWAEEEIRAGKLPAKSDIILRSVLFQGEISRADAASILGGTDRNARRITSALLKVGALASESTKSPLKLSFPAKLAVRWMPGLFPEK